MVRVRFVDVVLTLAFVLWVGKCIGLAAGGRNEVCFLGQAMTISFTGAIQDPIVVADVGVCSVSRITEKEILIVGRAIGETTIAVSNSRGWRGVTHTRSRT